MYYLIMADLFEQKYSTVSFPQSQAVKKAILFPACILEKLSV